MKLTTLGSRLAVARADITLASCRDISHKLYGYEWVKARKRFLFDNPICVYCLDRNGLVIEARVVDHIVPHRGDEGLFWDRNNWQSLCTNCHSSVKQKEEKKKYFM